MVMNATVMTNLMQSVFIWPTSASFKYFFAISNGVIKGLTQGVQIFTPTTGIMGSPGKGKMISLLGINSGMMYGFLQPDLIAEGLISPNPQLHQILIQAYSMMGDHIASFITIKLPPNDAVAMGTGLVTPGTIMLNKRVVKSQIERELLLIEPPAYSHNGMIIEVESKIASAISESLDKALKLSSQAVPITGGSPSPTPPVSMSGFRIGKVS